MQNSAVNTLSVTKTGPGPAPTPVTILITLKNDGTVSGQATVVLQGDGTLRAKGAGCVDKSDELVQVRLSGTITGPENSTQLHLQASSEAPPVAAMTGNCLTPLRVVPLNSAIIGNNATLNYDFPQAFVGAQKGAKLFGLNFPLAGVFVEMTAASQIAETKGKGAMTQKENWKGKTPPPHFLPSCKSP